LAASLATTARALVLQRYDVAAVRSAVLQALDTAGPGFDAAKSASG
jgi:hypothetical protein